MVEKKGKKGKKEKKGRKAGKKETRHAKKRKTSVSERPPEKQIPTEEDLLAVKSSTVDMRDPEDKLSKTQEVLSKILVQMSASNVNLQSEKVMMSRSYILSKTTSGQSQTALKTEEVKAASFTHTEEDSLSDSDEEAEEEVKSLKDKKKRKRSMREYDKDTDRKTIDEVASTHSTPLSMSIGQVSDKNKKGKKAKKDKKKTKKKTKKVTEEELKQEALEAEMALEIERIRKEEERKEGIKKEKKDTSEQILRIDQLQQSISFINHLLQENILLEKEEKKKIEWEQYLKCDGMPDPSNYSQMNTYLHLWDEDIDDLTLELASTRTYDIVKLLDELEDILDDSGPDVTSYQMDHWKWIRQLFRDHQSFTLDTATYILLRDIDKNLERVNIETSTYNLCQENLDISIWLRYQLPTFYPNPRRPPKPRIEIPLLSGKIEVVFPNSIDCERMAIRAMYLAYDHLSDQSPSFPCPELNDEYEKDLLEITLEEWNLKMLYKYENSPLAQQTNEKGEKMPIPEVIPMVPFQTLEPSPSQYFENLEDEFYNGTKIDLLKELDEGVVNMRKYRVLGGVYHLNLFYQPPQPRNVVPFDMLVTGLQMPLCLAEVPFFAEYKKPPEPEPGVTRLPEEIEQELKEQEAELDNLIFVTVNLPQNVMWFDVPVVCCWDKIYNQWTTTDIHDLKNYEEKCIVTFRTSRFGIFAVATNRYANLPYQAWELKPETDGSVTLQLTAAILMIDFNVKEGRVSIVQLQNGPNEALQDIVGTYFKLPKLMRILRNSGVDVFPESDAFCYVENSCVKHWAMERMLYYHMAQLSPAFNFAWSRWNMQAGRRKIIMQMRSYNPDRQKQDIHNMLLVTPLKALHVDCTEVSPVFNETGLESMKFYADLLHLMRATCGFSTRNKVQNGHPQMLKVLADLLLATKVLSFS